MKVFIHKFEAEHDGDVRREIYELEEAGAKVVHTYEEPHGDEDYMVELAFTCDDPKKFHEVIGWGLEEYPCCERPKTWR